MKGTIIALTVLCAVAATLLLLRHHVQDLIEEDRARILETAVVGMPMSDIGARLQSVGRVVTPEEAGELLFGNPPSTSNVVHFLAGISMVRVEGDGSNRVSSIEIRKIEWK